MNQISVFDKSAGGAVIPANILPEFKVYTHKDIDQIMQLKSLPEVALFEMKVVSAILPFRVNRYVIENLIDWSAFQTALYTSLRFHKKICRRSYTNKWPS
jgi:hypothetical protein